MNMNMKIVFELIIAKFHSSLAMLGWPGRKWAEFILQISKWGISLGCVNQELGKEFCFIGPFK